MMAAIIQNTIPRNNPKLTPKKPPNITQNYFEGCFVVIITSKLNKELDKLD